GRDRSNVEAKLAPVVAEVRRRLGNFILAEDEQTLESVVLAALAAAKGSLAVVETFTAGQIAARLAHQPGAEAVFRLGFVARDLARLNGVLGLDGAAAGVDAVAREARRRAGASHALAVLIDLDDGPDRIEFGGTINIAIA